MFKALIVAAVVALGGVAKAADEDTVLLHCG